MSKRRQSGAQYIVGSSGPEIHYEHDQSSERVDTSRIWTLLAEYQQLLDQQEEKINELQSENRKLRVGNADLFEENKKLRDELEKRTAKSSSVDKVIKLGRASLKSLTELERLNGEAGRNVGTSHSVTKNDCSFNQDVHVQDNEGHELLHRAVMEQNEVALKQILEKGADVNVPNSYEETLLITLAKHDNYSDTHMRMIKLLIENGANVYAMENGSTFLHHFFLDKTLTPNQFHELVVNLLEKGHSKLFDARGTEVGCTPLQLAVMKMKLQERTLSLLHSFGVRFNAIDKLGKSLLSYAVTYGNFNLIRNLIRFGANAQHLDNSRGSLFHDAAERKSERDLLLIARLLTENGADLNAIDKHGKSVLERAVICRKSTEFLQYLISHGADCSRVEANGRTILHTAAYWGTPEAVQLFLVSGFNSNIICRNGDTPLHYAVRLNDVLEKVTLLKERGANVTVMNKSGLTPLALAFKQFHISDDIKFELTNLLGRHSK